MCEVERRDAWQGCRASALGAVVVRGYPGGDAGEVEDMSAGEARHRGRGKDGGEERGQAYAARRVFCHD